MDAKHTPPSLGELLQHAAWARRLARGLVGNGTADDVVQETWLAALRRPPAVGQPLRPWLATVMRNKVFNRSREQGRRQAREGRDELREAPESAEGVLGRLEMHKILVEAVSELPEPYRQAVLLAYFEELTSAEIAEQHNVPAGTVRGRLKTALALLREALDRRLGSRGAWLPAATELARPSARLPRGRNAPATTQAGPPGAISAGATGGDSVLPVAAVVVAVAATAAMVWSIARRPPAASRRAVAESPGATTNRPGPPAATGVGRTVGVLAAPRTTAIHGFVVDGGPLAARAPFQQGRGQGGGIPDAVVRLVDGPPTRSTSTTGSASMHIQGRGFWPRIGLVPAGGSLVLQNDDPVPHLVRAASGAVELFGSVIPAGQAATVPIPRGTDVVRLEISEHRTATAFLLANENGVAVITNAYGEFLLWPVPPGRHTLEVWDETLGTKTVEITVPLAHPPLRIVLKPEPPPITARSR